MTKGNYNNKYFTESKKISDRTSFKFQNHIKTSLIQFVSIFVSQFNKFIHILNLCHFIPLNTPILRNYPVKHPRILHVVAISSTLP